MKFELEQIATIRSPFCELVDMPVQLKGAKYVYATIEFKKEFDQNIIRNPLP